MPLSDEIRSRWLKHLLSTAPAERPRAEAAVSELYAAAGVQPPRFLFWFDSPFDACWANALLAAPHSALWPRMLAGLNQIGAYREHLNRVREQIRRAAGESNWDSVLAVVGRPLSSRLGPPPAATPSTAKSLSF